jgi:hypothetical protein
MLFGADALDVADRYYAGSFGGTEGSAFVDELYRECQSQGGSSVSRDTRAWLRTRLEPAFPCVAARPKWLDEPEWPYFRGKPMVFVGQLTIPSSELSRELASPGDEVYVFTARDYEPGTRNWEVTYVTVSQSRAFSRATVVSDRPSRKSSKGPTK